MVDVTLAARADSNLQGRQLLAARTALYLVVAYITLTTSDIDVARVPLKLFVVAFAMIGWLTLYRPWAHPRRPYEFAAPVLACGIVIPVVWFGVALVLHHRHDPAQAANTSYAIQQASRFVYLLLYFPILDEIRRCETRAPDRPLRVHRVWLWPTLALCAISLIFFLGHVLLGLDYGGGDVGPFQGAIAPEATGTFRVYLIDDVMLIPATALLLATARRGRLGDFGVVVAFALLATAYISHTRGIWLGMVIAAAGTLLLASVPLPLSRRARVAGVLLACVSLAAFVINADPSLSHRAVGLVTRPHELSTSYRLDEATQLLSGFRRHPVLGSGLGATLPSGYRRSNSAPWSFELTYLQLLFQLGIVGTWLVLAIPAWALYCGARALGPADQGQRIMIAAAVAGLMAFMFTSAGNPYLMTSVGMLALAVLLAMTELAMASKSIPARTADATLGLARLRNVSALTRLRTHRPRQPTALFWIVALIGVLALAEFARSRQSAPSTLPASTTAPALPPPASAARRVLRLPASYLLDGSAQLVSDSEDLGGSGLWSVSVSKGTVGVSEWNLSSGRILTGPTVPAGPSPHGEGLSFGVVSLGAAYPDVLGVMSTLNGRIHVELRDLADAGRALIAGETPSLALAPGEDRDMGLASWTGSGPDLIVVDRSATAPVMHVQVFSATSDFHEELLDVIIPKGPFPAAAFSLLIGAVNSPTTDLMLVSRGATSTSHTEVHVLLGPQAFQVYGEQSPVNLPEALPPTTTFLLAHEGGLPVLYVETRQAGTLEVVQLA